MQLLNFETQQGRETKLVLYLQHLRTYKSVHKKVQFGGFFYSSKRLFPLDRFFLDFKILPLIFLPNRFYNTFYTVL